MQLFSINVCRPFVDRLKLVIKNYRFQKKNRKGGKIQPEKTPAIISTAGWHRKQTVRTSSGTQPLSGLSERMRILQEPVSEGPYMSTERSGRQAMPVWISSAGSRSQHQL